MILFLKALSRSVHDELQEQQENKPEIIDNDGGGMIRSLTVWRKSLIINCYGFTVFDSNGDLVYRVDNYIGGRRPEELTLMDAAGKSILSMLKRKKLGLTDMWQVYEGEVSKDCGRTRTSQKPIWCVRKQNMKMFLQGNNQNVLAYVYRGQLDHSKRCCYVVEGSYVKRSCKILDESRRVVAEIKRKEAGGVSFGMEVFVLSVQPGFDPGFAMALVLLLDQMFS